MRNESRFHTPKRMNEFESEYDIPSEELQDLIARQPSVVTVKNLAIGAAAGRLTINEPGFGFVLYGYNTQNNAKYSEAFCNVAVNSDGSDISKIFPAKTGRGFRGAFTTLTLFWPQDPIAVTNAAWFVIFKSRKMPWMGGLEAF